MFRCDNSCGLICSGELNSTICKCFVFTNSIWLIIIDLFSFVLVLQPKRLVALRPPPVADKGSKALSEITSKRQYIYVQRIATIFQTGEHGSPLQSGYKFVLQIDYLPDHNCPTGQFHRPQGRFHLTKSDFTRHRRISPTFSGIILKK